MNTYVVTGANRGIGLELARQLAERGERVIGTAREPNQASGLRQLDVRVEELDVASGESVEAFAQRLKGEPVDVLINNAGRYGGRHTLGELDIDRMLATFEVNALGPLRVTQALLANLHAGRKKRIVNVTSKMGSIADNTSGGSYSYRASKAALNAITKSLAVDLGSEGFVCVVLHPGWVRTDMGGSAAPVAVAESVEGMLEVIDGLSPDRNGAFFDFKGQLVPW